MVNDKNLLSAFNVDLIKFSVENNLKNSNSMEIFEKFFIEKSSDINFDKPILITNWKQKCSDRNIAYVENIKIIGKSSIEKLKIIGKSWLLKMKGAGVKKLSKEPFIETILTVFGAFISMLAITTLDHFVLRPNGYIFAIAPFSAMAVIMFYYHTYNSPFSQPRNAIFANIMAALIAVGIRKCVGEQLLWFGCSLAVGVTMAAMCFTNTVNPPAGATAMTVFYGGPLVVQQGFMFVIIPTAVGTCLFVIMVLLINNISPRRRYPTFWFY